ncbi:MAG: hypothetical protein NXH70_02600 [Hyphomonas sp.]|nr:hypothetical protein [Hyphomonas sp.]
MTDWIADLTNYVRTNAANFSDAAFAYQLPEGRSDPAVVIAPPTEGIAYNEQLPDRYRGQYRAVVTTKSIADAHDYAEEILRLLTLFNTRVGSFTVMRSFPLRTPIVFPKANSDLFEVSIPFEIIMVDRRIRIGSDLVGSSSLSMGTFSLAAQGVLAINGGASFQLDPFMAIGVAAGHSGDADMMLQPFLLSGASTTSIAAVLDTTIDAFTMSGTGASSAFPGQLISTLAEFAINANATTRIEMAGGYTMGDFTISGAAKPGITALAAVTLDDFAANASAVTFFPATATIVMDDFTATASAEISTDAGAIIGMDDFALSANADMPLEATMGVSFPALTLAGSAPMKIEGSSIVMMDDFTLVATDSGSKQGSASLSMDDFTLVASAALLVDAVVTLSMDDFTLAGTGETEISSVAATTMGEFTTSSIAATFLPATANIQMDDFIVAATATPSLIDGVASVVMDDFTAAATSVLGQSGDAFVDIPAWTIAAAGSFKIDSSATMAMDDFIVVSAAHSSIYASGNVTLGDFSSSGISQIDIEGVTSTVMGSFTANGTSENIIPGTATITIDAFTLATAANSSVSASAALSMDAFSISANGNIAPSGGNETETDALLARMTVAPDATLEGHINTLIKAIKDTNAWSIMDRVYLPILHDQQASLVDWTGNGSDITLTGSPVYTNYKGIAIAGSGYGSIGLDVTSLTNFDTSGFNGHWGAAWHTLNTAVSDSRCLRDSGNKHFVRTDSRQFRIFGGSNGQFPVPAANQGVAHLVTASATDSMEEHFSDGSLIRNDTVPGASAGSGSMDIGWGSNNAANNAICAGYWIGGKLTRQQGIDVTAAVKTFLDAVLVYP